MPVKFRCLLTTAVVALASTPALAQPISAEEAATMRAQIQALQSQISTLQARLDAAGGPTPVAGGAAPGNAAPVIASTDPRSQLGGAPEPTRIVWRGAPEFSTESGFSFKPRGRLQVDVGGVDAPAAVMTAANQEQLGFASEIRRLFLGFDGKIPGGFGYRLEIDFGANAVNLNDAYLTYDAGDVDLTLGYHRPPWSIEETTSDLFTSFPERASFTQAFGFERRLGLSAQWNNGGPVTLQGGLFSYNIATRSPANNSWSAHGRAVFAPKWGETQLHLAASLHNTVFNDGNDNFRLRARPGTHVTDLRFVDTGPISADGTWNYGVEMALARGRFHGMAEYGRMTVRRPGVRDPQFAGGYAEAGVFLTNDRRVYRSTTFDRVSPSNPITKGGMGALELNLRYDWLDLNDGGILGGQQQIYLAGLTWVPVQWIRFIGSYGHIIVDSGNRTSNATADFNGDMMMLRAQMDF